MHLPATFIRQIAAVLLIVLSPQLADAETYKIQLLRVQHAGDEFITNLTVTIKRTTEPTVNGKPYPKQTEEVHADLRGVVKVLEVDPASGLTSKISFTVEHFKQDGVDLYPAGTAITAERAGQQIKYSIDGKDIGKENLQLMLTVLNITDPDESLTAQDATAMAQPQGVGANWPLDADALAKQLDDQNLGAAAENIKGSGALVEVKTLNGTEAMTVHHSLAVTGLHRAMPNGGSISEGVLSIESDRVVPTDLSLPVISINIKSKSTHTLHLSSGKGTLTTTTERDYKEAREPMKAN